MERPLEITPVTLAPRLEVLPTEVMPWESFELLLRRLAQEVRGLRQVQRYGVRGQAQHGIDIVGRAADSDGEAIQGKRYDTFTVADLTRAVQKFLAERAEIPFKVTNLFIAAGCDVERTEIVNELYLLNEANPDVEIELWDRRQICDMLRHRRDIVTEFFGDSAADLFCLPSMTHVVDAPSPDRVSLADASVRGPARIVGADQRLAEAARLEPLEPLAAAAEIEAAEQLLAGGGFAAHAAVLTRRRAEILASAGEKDSAAGLLSMQFWRALDAFDTEEAERLSRTLTSISAEAEASQLGAIAEAAISVVRHPLRMPTVDLSSLAGQAARPEYARLVLLMAETSAIDPRDTWALDNLNLLAVTADAIDSIAVGDSGLAELAHRLRIEIADITGHWAPLLALARRHHVDRPISIRILARHGAHHADRDGFDDADESWELAIQHACLEGHNSTATDLVQSRRVLWNRYQGASSEDSDFLVLQKSLQALGDRQERSSIDRLEVHALDAIVDGKGHVAVPLLRSILRFAYSTGRWAEIGRVRELLADCYQTAEEYDLAATHFVLAGQSSTAAEAASAAGDYYVDVRDHLTALAYWVAASAFRVIAAQADLVPDDQVSWIADLALDVLRRQDTGQLLDSVFAGPSLALEALRAIAGLAARTTTDQATALLDYLRPRVPREPNRYRFTGDHHVQACAGIASTHDSLRSDALGQLLDLLSASTSGVSQKVERDCGDLFCRYPDLVRGRLMEMAGTGNRPAATLLALMTDEPTDAQLAAARDAASKLAEPSHNTATTLGIGTGAISQSLLAIYLPAAERRLLVQAQLKRAASPYETSDNRGDYYITAANLAQGLDNTDELFEEAMRRAADASPSHGDILSNLGNHPLGMFRFTGGASESRTHATLLAARLARSPEQKQRVRRQAIALLGAHNAGYYCARPPGTRSRRPGERRPTPRGPPRLGRPVTGRRNLGRELTGRPDYRPNARRRPRPTSSPSPRRHDPAQPSHLGTGHRVGETRQRPQIQRSYLAQPGLTLG